MGEDWLRTGIGRLAPDPFGLPLWLDVEHRATYTGSRRADRGDTPRPPGYTAGSPDG